jgi:hypothetical protein
MSNIIQFPVKAVEPVNTAVDAYIAEMQDFADWLKEYTKE